MNRPKCRAISGLKKNKLKEELINNFAKPDILLHNHLIWNSLSKKPKVYKSKNESAIIPDIRSKNKFIYFNEREDKFYKIAFYEFKEIIKSLEPWEELDAYFFDESMSWLIAHTHDRHILVVGKLPSAV